MNRVLWATLPLLSLTSVPLKAAPPIVYAVHSGNGNQVWLVNPDGSSAKAIYSGASSTGLSFLDARPGGGQVAVVENGNSIRLINYDANGNPTGTSNVPVPAGCNIQGLDYHPSDGSLLYSETCNSGTNTRIERFANGQVSDVMVGITYPYEVRWTRDGLSFLWRAASSATGQQLRLSSMSNPLAYTVIWQMPSSQGLQSIDIAHTTDAFLLTWSGPPAYVYRYSFNSAGVSNQGVVANGQNGHYSPDDSGILYRVQTNNGYNLTVHDTQGTRVVASGKIGVSDWQQ